MVDVERVMRALTSERSRFLQDVGRLTLSGPAPPKRVDLARQHLAGKTGGTLGSLGRVFSGFTLRSGSEEDDCVEFQFLPDEDCVTWPTVYPRGMDLAVGPRVELLVVDFEGSSADPVYHVSHEPPSHVICFESFVECIDHFIYNDAPDARILECVNECVDWPNVRDFNADTPSVAEFLAGFPPHYWVHDLRRRTKGAGFPYFVTRPEDIVRFGDERLWVQRRPSGLGERLAWFWKTGSFGAP